MEITGQLKAELKKMGYAEGKIGDLEKISGKDGVHVYNVQLDGEHYVMKYFETKEYTREISNYKLLMHLKIPVIPLKRSTMDAILLEDMRFNPVFRLGEKEDLKNPEIGRSVAQWYKMLHEKGRKLGFRLKKGFYRESGLLTIENLRIIKEKSNTIGNALWDVIEPNLKQILRLCSRQEQTLNYNDFYWTNLVVSRDYKKAFMFDYNFLGIGLAYNDIRNVCSSLSDEAAEAFLKEYGEYNIKEKILDDALADLINLISAYQRPVFPSWAMNSLTNLVTGKVEQKIKKMMELI